MQSRPEASSSAPGLHSVTVVESMAASHRDGRQLWKTLAICGVVVVSYVFCNESGMMVRLLLGAVAPPAFGSSGVTMLMPL